MQEEIRLDVLGDVVTVGRPGVEALRVAAAARAGVSSRHRDLSLVLDRALATGSAVLGRPDLRTLLATVEAEPAARMDERLSQLLDVAAARV